MSFITEGSRNVLRKITPRDSIMGWALGKSTTQTSGRAWRAYQGSAPPGPYDYGFQPTQLTRRAFNRLPQKTRHTILTQSKEGG